MLTRVVHIGVEHIRPEHCSKPLFSDVVVQSLYVLDVYSRSAFLSALGAKTEMVRLVVTYVDVSFRLYNLNDFVNNVAHDCHALFVMRTVAVIGDVSVGDFLKILLSSSFHIFAKLGKLGICVGDVFDVCERLHLGDNLDAVFLKR